MNPQIVAYIKANPGRFTYKEIALKFGVSTDRVRGLLTTRNLKNHAKRDILIANRSSFTTEQEIAMEPKHVTRYRNFAKVWNDKSYVAMYDLVRVLGIEDVRQLARRYTKFRLKNPSFNLHPLVIRKEDGSILPMPESVSKELDEFRFTGELGKKFIVTSAQFGSPLNPLFWKSLQNYAKHVGYTLVVLPIKYGSMKEKGGRLTSLLPPELKGYVLLEDVNIDGKLNLNATFRMRPTLERFLTPTVCNVGGNVSQIFAGPKLELEFLPRISTRKQNHYPKAVMTTGAVTRPNYSTDNLGQQDRTGQIASENHCYSAIIVEFDSDVFHFRQLLANRRGEFYDITKDGVVFSTSQGVRKADGEVEAIVCGDWHTGKTEPTVRETTFGKGGIVDTLKPKHVVLHDFFDGDSISHHGVHETTRSAYMGLQHLQWDSLELELNRSIEELDWIHARVEGQLHLIPSNHPEFVVEFINSMRWTKEKPNMYIGAKLFQMMIDDMRKRQPLKVHSRATDPIALYFRERAPYAHIVERQDTFVLPKSGKEILLSLHGDVGTRGGPTRSVKDFLKMNIPVYLGHNHSACIYGSVWRVGTSTYRMQFYVSNPATNWTNSHGLIYANGQRQLLNIIKGKWRGA